MTALLESEIPTEVADLLKPDVTILDDIHTHLFPPSAGDDLALRGIDHMLGYHYVSRLLFGHCRDVDPVQFAALPVEAQGDLVWKRLFVETDSDPLDEGRRGVITTLKLYGLDPHERTLNRYREFFRTLSPEDHVNRVLGLAGVRQVICTNDPFNLRERKFYLDPAAMERWDPRFAAALRLDELILHWKRAQIALSGELGATGLTEELTSTCLASIRAFLVSWIKRLPNARYVACSFPPKFNFMDRDEPGVVLLQDAVIPVCAELGLPLFIMPEPIRKLNKDWGNAGDWFGKADLTSFAELVALHPEVDFWVTPLNLASQYELAGLSCVLPNVIVWGLWWFNLQPSLVDSITRMRIEMNGPRFWPFNSDGRVLDQLGYKWAHFRDDFARVLTDEYVRLHRSGWKVTRAGIETTIRTWFDPKRLLPSTFHTAA